LESKGAGSGGKGEGRQLQSLLWARKDKKGGAEKEKMTKLILFARPKFGDFSPMGENKKSQKILRILGKK